MKMIHAPESLIEKWRIMFLNDVSKFLNPSFLEFEDLDKEFTDAKGVAWKLLGSLETTREVGCRNLETGRVWSWERWKVSEILRPKEHAAIKEKFRIAKIVKKGTRPSGYDPIVHKELQLESKKKQAQLDVEGETFTISTPPGNSLA